MGVQKGKEKKVGMFLTKAANIRYRNKKWALAFQKKCGGPGFHHVEEGGAFKGSNIETRGKKSLQNDKGAQLMNYSTSK